MFDLAGQYGVGSTWTCDSCGKRYSVQLVAGENGRQIRGLRPL